MERLLFPITVGSNGDDDLIARGDTVLFGLRGDDHLRAAPHTDYNLMFGGPGDNVYEAANGAAITIINEGGGYDTLVADGLGLDRPDTYVATVEGGHVVALDTLSGQQVTVTHWQDPAQRIEEFRLADGVYDYATVRDAIFDSPNYLGEFSMSDMVDFGMMPPGTTGSMVDEAREHYGELEQTLMGQADLLDDQPSPGPTVINGFLPDGSTLADVIGYAADTRYLRLYDKDTGQFLPGGEDDAPDGWYTPDQLDDLPVPEHGTASYYVAAWGPGGTGAWTDFTVQGNETPSFVATRDWIVPDTATPSLAELVDASGLDGDAWVRVHNDATGEIVGGDWLAPDELADHLPELVEGGETRLWVDTYLHGAGRSGWDGFNILAVDEALVPDDAEMPAPPLDPDLESDASQTVKVLADHGTGITQGSGVLVADNVVLTAAHVLLDMGGSGDLADAVSVELEPELADMGGPFGAEQVQYFEIEQSGEGTINRENAAIDTGIIALDEPAPGSITPMEIDSDFSAGQVYVSGFPGSADGELVTLDAYATTLAVPGSDLTLLELDFVDDVTESGFSGGPVWYEDEGQAHVVGTVVGGDWAYDLSSHPDEIQEFIDDYGLGLA